MGVPMVAAVVAANVHGASAGSPEDMDRIQDAVCREWGAVPGTDVYVQCRLELLRFAAQAAEQRAQSQQDRRARIRDALRGLSEMFNRQPQVTTLSQQPTIHCQTWKLGDTVQTNCH